MQADGHWRVELPSSGRDGPVSNEQDEFDIALGCGLIYGPRELGLRNVCEVKVRQCAGGRWRGMGKHESQV